MEEAEFWPALEFRVTLELPRLRGQVAEFWCDGFAAEEYALTENPARLSGRMWLGRSGQDEWRFDLLLPGPIGSVDDVDWSELLPDEDVTGWLDIDVRAQRVTVTPASANPVTD